MFWVFFKEEKGLVSLFKLPYCGIIRICGGSILNSMILWVPFNRGLKKSKFTKPCNNLKFFFFYFLKNVEVSVNIQIKTMV